MTIKIIEVSKGVEFKFIKFEDVFGKVVAIKGWQYVK